MNNRRPTVVDLFSGAGGFSLGFEQAGFDVVAAVEIDPVHACVHKFNFPNCAVIPKSIIDVDGAEILRISGITSNKKIDVVVGGAPCQGFSIIGQRVIDDPRNSLVKEFIRLVYQLAPSYFLFENVRGITFGKFSHFLDEVIDEFNKCGYSVLPAQVLNAKNFGVPQSRERLFLIGARKDKPLPKYPRHFNKQITCVDALDDLPDADVFDQLLINSQVRAEYLRCATGYSARMRCSTKESWLNGYKRQWDSAILTNSHRTNHSKISRERFENTEQGKREPISRFLRLSPNGVSSTLRAGTDSARGSFTSPRPIHYKYPRCVTVREMARLHGFPDWFQFHETKWHGARQIGNSVPPPFAYAFAIEIIKMLRGSAAQPTKSISLGHTSLLEMSIPSASKYWGIENPIKKRIRKSFTS